jgi:TetR/AcrR family transcriptional regulator, transcriptional repressor for nem operon
MEQAHEIQDVSEHILSVAQKIIAAKGYAAVGLTEILTAAEVPKGSFYHYFKSKDAFGEAMLKRYFENYVIEMDAILNTSDKSYAKRLIDYWKHWHETQESFDCQGKCLAVKLAAEVADFSEPMRLALKQGTADIITRLGSAIESGVSDGSLNIQTNPNVLAKSLYQLWLGASLMAKITRTKAPLENAMSTTKVLMHLE